jgi:preprotein translocase subunit YajC
MGYAILPLLFVAMWVFTIRPQQQRLRNQRALVYSLEAGDEVITVGGLIGVIKVLDDRELKLDVGNGVEVRVARSAVQARFGPDPEPEPDPDPDAP